MEEIIQKCLPTYDLIEKIGEGIFGSVYRVRDSFKERAVKVVPILQERSRTYQTSLALDSKLSQDFHAVREYYDQIKGDGVVEIYDFHLVDKQVSEHQAKAYLVILMELCPANLRDYVLDNSPLSLDQGRELMVNLAHILNRLIHGQIDAFLITDLKPANLLLNHAGRLVIGDLGGIKRISSVCSRAKAQYTPNWTAPEIILKGDRPTIASIVYSFGLVSYFMWEGCLPFEDVEYTQRWQALKEKDLTFSGSNASKSIEDLIKRCLQFEPRQRINEFAEILSELDQYDSSRERMLEMTTVLPTTNNSIESPSANDILPVSSDLGASETRNRTYKSSASRPASSSQEMWQEPVTGMIFIRIPGGSFPAIRDSNHSSNSSRSKISPHASSVLGFWMGKYLVTQQQWRKVMPDNPSHFKKGNQYPVEQVSWNDIQIFIQKLTALNGGQCAFQLPTQTQWEYAASSGGKAETYAGGNDADDLAWHAFNSDNSVHPVGAKRPNGLGLYDMSGNIWEWCQDFCPTDAAGIDRLYSTTLVDDRFARVYQYGGCYYCPPDKCRTTSRRKRHPGERAKDAGFRLIWLPRRH